MPCYSLFHQGSATVADNRVRAILKAIARVQPQAQEIMRAHPIPPEPDIPQHNI